MRIGLIATAGVAVLIAVGGVVNVQNQESKPSGIIEASHIFDVENARLVAGFADAVLVGTVTAIAGTEPDLARTQYAFTVQQRYAGEAQPSITVEQIGYRDEEDGVTYQDESQPILEVGQRYVLAVTRGDDGVFTVVGGRHGATPIARGKEAAVEAQWKDHVRNRQRPPGL